jgi:hypothetical protein
MANKQVMRRDGMTMRRKLAANRWWPLYHELDIDTFAGALFAPKASAELLDGFEARTAFKLPPSYREFASLFGGGELAGWFTIFSPLGAFKPKADYLNWRDLKWHHDKWQKVVQDRSHVWQDPERLGRMVFFCEAFSGPFFGWDPEDRTPKEPGEYRVSRRERNGEFTEVVAASFTEFVKGYCFPNSPYGAPDYVPEDEYCFKDPYHFEPTHMVPSEEGRSWPVEQCKRFQDAVAEFGSPVEVDPNWLRHDGEAVLRLAYAIHDEDRFGDMPILADALEEAGCTSRLILDHCRNGCWHLRNCWVLKLLFEQE